MDHLLDLFEGNKTTINLCDLEIYQTLFNEITDMIFIVDLNGTILNANASMESIMGYKIEEYKHRSFLSLYQKKSNLSYLPH